MWIEPASWLDFLERDALAWQSFDVLDDLAMAVEALPVIGSGATLLEPLLERGAALLEANLAAAPPGNGTLQWGWVENRPALRMLAHLAWRAAADMDRGAPPERFVGLAERYPEDFCGPTLNRILALVRLGRRAEALVALRDAAGRHRVAIEMLLAEAPRRPKPDPGFGVVMGGKEEAWDYRAAQRALWERDGALDWLRAAWNEVRKAHRPYTGKP